MEQSPTEYSTEISEPTINSEPCFHFPSVQYETGSSTVPYIVNVSLNVLLALVTTVANALVLSAIRKNTYLHLPLKLLLGSLVLSDLGVGITVQPTFVAFLLTKAKGVTNMCFAHASFGISASILTCVSLLTMTVISLDRYIALYPQVPWYCNDQANFLVSCCHLAVAYLISLRKFHYVSFWASVLNKWKMALSKHNFDQI